MRQKPGHTPTRHTTLIVRTYTWLNRRGVRIHGICKGVLDLDTRGLYIVDMVGERRGRVVLVILYCSPGRAQVAGISLAFQHPSKLTGARQDWDAMEAHVRRIASLCRENYLIDPDVALVNVYGDGRVQGKLWTA